MAFECQDHGTNLDYYQKNFKLLAATLWKQFLLNVIFF